MPDGAEIPIDRTAVPVEWDDVKTQLSRLATELGPSQGVSDTATARFIDSAADAMAGNGDKLRQTLAQLSGVGRILADGSGNIVDIIKNLQTFISALRDSSTQIVEFQGRLATLTSVLDGSRSDLDNALTNVAEVVDDVERFVKNTRSQTAEQIQRLANVTQNVVDHQKDLEQILHVAPTAIANTLNMFDPRDGGATGIFTLVQHKQSRPIHLRCDRCHRERHRDRDRPNSVPQYLGPALNLMNVNYLPLPINPVLDSCSCARHDLVYTDPALAPGGRRRYRARPKHRRPSQRSPEQETCHRRPGTGQPAPPPAGTDRLPGFDAAAGRDTTRRAAAAAR